jgi:hypothetical protein
MRVYRRMLGFLDCDVRSWHEARAVRFRISWVDDAELILMPWWDSRGASQHPTGGNLIRSLTRTINRLFRISRRKFCGSHPDQFLNHHRSHFGKFI